MARRDTGGSLHSDRWQSEQETCAIRRVRSGPVFWSVCEIGAWTGHPKAVPRPGVIAASVGAPADQYSEGDAFTRMSFAGRRPRLSA